MRITDVILGEHAVFRAQFAPLMEMAASAESLREVKNLVSVLDAALATHAALENDLLFPALEEQLPSDKAVSELRVEHLGIDATLARIQGAGSLPEARSLLQGLMEVASGHFAREEEELVPMAEGALSGATLGRLGAAWAAQRKVRIP